MKRLFGLPRRLWARVNDLALNIYTSDSTLLGREIDRPLGRDSRAPGARPMFADAVAYESPDYWYVRKLRRRLFGSGDPDEVFVDLGSGKGRILCVMARVPLKKVVGIELARGLCRDAQRNSRTLRRRHAPIEVICQDAATADLSEGTVFFLFNPFGVQTLQVVCENLRRSLESSPRRVRIVYYNAVHEDVLASAGWLRKMEQFETLNGLFVQIWKNE